MGWTFCNKPAGQSTREFFEHHFNGPGKVIDCATVGSTAYLAYERIDKGERKVSAIVCLTERAREERFNFGYKDMGEEMGPYFYECPARILDQLTETTDQSALSWRAKCRATNERKAKLVPGCLIEFAEPLKFSDGSVAKRFTYRPEGRTAVFVSEGGSRYRISRFQTREFQIL